MKNFKLIIVTIVFALLSVSCGVDGDPGHCYFSIDWEYYNENYRVYYYEDNNPDVPESDDIEAGYYYDCYPGLYDYYYESEDPEYWYEYTGFYELIQNPGTPGGFLHDGLDGADTHIELYLYIYARKSLGTTEGIQAPGDDLSATTMLSNGATTLSADIYSDNAVAQRSRSGRLITGDPLRVEINAWEKQQGDWVLHVEEQVKVYKKQ